MSMFDHDTDDVVNLRLLRRSSCCTVEESMNQMSLMAGAMTNNNIASSSIDGGSGSSTDGGGGGGIGDTDSRRHIDFVINDGTTTNSSLDPNQEVVTESTSTGGADYYAKGSAEVATESALTLAKIQHVSSHMY
jgi:hypothetical protein